MWKSKRYDEFDGLTPLLEFFKNEDDFIEHYIKYSRFFSPEAVQEQAKVNKEKVETGEKFPVRFSKKNKEYFYFKNEQGKESKRTFKTKEDAKRFTESNDLIHRDTEMSVEIDKDGNYYVRKAIVDHTGLRISQGAISNVKNSVISHIWGKTENPLFFTSLWNIAITPNYLSFILDKPDANGDLVKRIKRIFKATCYLLYSPQEEIDPKWFDEKEFASEIEFARTMIDAGNISFISSASLTPTYVDNRDVVERLYVGGELKKNKDFIFDLLDQLKTSGIDFTNQFLSREKTSDICKLSYPILVDITSNSEGEIEKKRRPVKSDVYYSKPYFEIKNKKYLVCNDWKPKNKELLIDWLIGSVNDDIT